MTPFGQFVEGWEVTIDDGLPPAKVDYARERITEILHAGLDQQKIKETHDAAGHFKSFTVTS